jgi:hypothetical protein
MRYLGSAIQAAMTVVAVAACFLNWGVVQYSWGQVSGKDGWRYGAPSEILFPYWVGDWTMPHPVVPVALGLTTLASWGRARRYRVPAAVSLILSGYAAYHPAAYLWLYSSDYKYLIGSSLKAVWPGTGVYMALAAGLTAFVASVVDWRLRRRTAARRDPI